MNSTTSTSTSGSLLLEDSLDQDNTLDTVKVCDEEVQPMEAPVVTDTSEAASPPRPTLNLAALEALQASGTLKVTFPRSLQKKEVTTYTPPPLD